jgi:hypothetical protein
VTDPVPRLAPRSAVAVADVELLRLARTDIGEPATTGGRSLTERLRGLAQFRTGRDGSDDEVRIGRADD